MSFEKLDSYLTGCTNKKEIPGCVCYVGNAKQTFFFEAYGRAQIVPKLTGMKKDTVFDLASLTKPIVTAVLIMLLQDRNQLELDDRVAGFLPELKDTATEGKTLKQLLIHNSGLPAWYPTYLFPEKKRLKGIAELNTGKEEVVYSCLGYILLGKVIEQIAKTNLAEFFQQNIAGKLRLETMTFGPVDANDSVAPSELGNQHERKMASKYGDISGIEWRQDLIHGEVHDGNVFYGFNNVAGNAGLFANAADITHFTRAYLAGEIISSEAVNVMTKEFTVGEEKRGLGWKIDMYPGLLSPVSFGHSGFTGTLLVVDPQRDLIIILLANAVHPDVKLNLMNPIRRETVRLITASLAER